MDYIAEVLNKLLVPVFFIFVIAALGYFIGGISIKGISLGTSGVLLMALAYGIIASYLPQFSIGETNIVLFDGDVDSMFGLVQNIGTSLFVTAVGLIAGPKFFRSLNKKFMSYVIMGVAIIGTGIVTLVIAVKLGLCDAAMGAGLLTGALTSTPGMGAAVEAVGEAGKAGVTAGYAIAYIFGVLGVVFFVQLVPRFLKVNIAQERENFKAATTVTVPTPKKKVMKLDSQNFFAFMLTIMLGYIIGRIYIPGIDFSLGASGGTLVAGLIVGHFGHIGPIDLRMDEEGLDFFRELGLMLFLIGAGVPGGVSFMENVKISYFIVGVFMTLIPMVIGYILARYVFKLSIFNNLGSITGGMTSTPALGTLINVAGTGDVAAAYASTYPVALVLIVLFLKVIVPIL